MTEFLSAATLWAVLLTLGAYELGCLLKKKTGLAVCSPILVGAVLIIGFLLLTGIPNETYQAGVRSISWLLTPCTVCLAIPLYTELEKLRGDLPAILAGVLGGVLVSLGMIGLFCILFRLPPQVTASLLPKSITTAMALPLSERMDALPALTTAAVIVTGILGSVLGPALCRIFRIRHPIAQGVAFGTASHVIGTTRATELSALSGAVGSLSLVIAGIVTAVLYPLAIRLFG